MSIVAGPPTGHTVGGRRNDGLMQRKPVNADIQEAADHDSKYKDYDVWNRVQKKKHREFLSGVKNQLSITCFSYP